MEGSRRKRDIYDESLIEEQIMPGYENAITD